MGGVQARFGQARQGKALLRYDNTHVHTASYGSHMHIMVKCKRCSHDSLKEGVDGEMMM